MMHLIGWMPSGFEWVFIAVLGVLLFGKRLPEVGKSVGQMIVNFKKGMRETQDEISTAGELPDAQANRQALPEGGYKFDPQTGKPLDGAAVNTEQSARKFDPYTGQPLSQ